MEELESYDEQERSRERGDEEAKKIRFRFLGLLGQGHNIAIHIRGSPAWIDEFKELAGRLVPLDNRMR